MPPSHQTLRLVPAVKLLGIMFRNRWWPITFHTITAGDVDRWHHNWLVWWAPQENQCWSRTTSLITGKRRVVGGPVFENMGVASWHFKPYPIKFPLHLGGFVLIHTRIWCWAVYMETHPYIDQLTSMRIFTLIMNKIIICDKSIREP